MAEVNKAGLKTYFETGDKPTSQNFIDLIDSAFNLAKTGSVSFAGGVSGSLTSTGSFGYFTVAADVNFINLPTVAVSASVGGLYTLSGSQLPLSGSTSELNAISSSKFVLVK